MSIGHTCARKFEHRQMNEMKYTYYDLIFSMLLGLEVQNITFALIHFNIHCQRLVGGRTIYYIYIYLQK